LKLTLTSVIEWYLAVCAALAALAVWSGLGDVWSLAAGCLWVLANVGAWSVLVRTLVAARIGGVVTTRARLVAVTALLVKFSLFVVVAGALWLRVRLEPLSFAAAVASFTVAAVFAAMTAPRAAALREA